ncbi:MAG: alpha/beta fold hydrolase, partial [Bacteriovoracia bacterium]
MKMIFLHGFPDNSRTWDHLVAHFQNHSPCHAPDIHSLTLSQQVALIGELAAGEPLVLIAHDMGGPAAVEFAQKNQQQVKHLILINSMGLDMFAHRLRSLDQLLKSS